MWVQSRYALDFFSKYNIPFHDMVNNNSRVTNNNWCLVERLVESVPVVVVYLKRGGTASVNLSGLGSNDATMSVMWYDPRNGGTLQTGSVSSVRVGSSAQPLGSAPKNDLSDWVILLQCLTGC